MKVLVCNAGSTSLKFRLYEMPQCLALASGKIERVKSRNAAIFHYANLNTGLSVNLTNQDVPSYTDGIQKFLACLTGAETGVISDICEIDRVGFKTVLANGYYGVHELTEDVLRAMEDRLTVAPAHNGPYLEVICEFSKILPNAMLVGAFETAFHTTVPLERRLYGVPYEWYERYGVARLGYHGASHSYIADVVERQEGTTGRMISCHLGGSCSICAVLNGKSVDTSFGFSLQTGVIHANRVGDADPYLFPFLISQGLSPEEILDGFDRHGGLLGISGVSNDLRQVEEAADSGSPRARLAIEMFLTGIVRYIGAFYAELGGLDHLVFTGGIGENSERIRNTVCERLGHLGIITDKPLLLEEGHFLISHTDSLVKVHVIAANEELGVAKKTADCVRAGQTV